VKIGVYDAVVSCVAAGSLVEVVGLNKLNINLGGHAGICIRSSRELSIGSLRWLEQVVERIGVSVK
jgi:hypothetical protein